MRKVKYSMISIKKKVLNERKKEREKAPKKKSLDKKKDKNEQVS